MTPRPFSTGSGYRARLGAAVRRRRRATAGEESHPVPALSVVVPFYNVEAYLEACLASIRRQSFSDFEVVMVDDGSPDASIDIARRFAVEDERFRLVTRENGGLGAARNTGVRESRGTRLTFVDSDDVLPADAFAALTSAADRTGADIVVGAVERFDGRRSWNPDWVAVVHARERVFDRVEDFLPVLRNLYTWNKVFRRDFWDRCGLEFREGVAYEDQPIITQLYAEASRIVVLPDVVYRHRVREDRSSISQQVGSMSDLLDRTSAWRETRTALTERPDVYRGWIGTLFAAHFHWYLGALDRVSDDYWRVLREAVVEFLDDASPQVWSETAPTKRVPLELVRQGRRADIVAFVAAGGRNGDRWPARPGAGGLVVQLPFVDDPALAEDLFVLHPDQVQLEHRVDALHWSGAGLEVIGWCYPRRLDAGTPIARLGLRWRNDRTDEAVLCPGEVGIPMVFDPPFEDAAADYTGRGFRCVVPMGELAGLSGSAELWSAELVLTVGTLELCGALHAVRAGVVSQVPGVAVVDGRLVVPTRKRDRGLQVRVSTAAVVVADIATSDRQLLARVTGSSAGDVVGLRLVSDGHDDVVSDRAADGRFRLLVPEPDPATKRRLVADLLDGQVVRPPVDHELLPRLADIGSTSLVVGVAKDGGVVITGRSTPVLVDEIEVIDGRLRVTGRVCEREITSVSLTVAGHPGDRGAVVSATGGLDLVPADLWPRRFQVEHDLTADRGPYGRLAVPIGTHELVLQVSRDDDVEAVAAAPAEQLSRRLPYLLKAPRHDIRLLPGAGGGLRLGLLRPLGAARGRLAQHVLRGAAPATETSAGVVMDAPLGGTAWADLAQVRSVLLRRAPDVPVWWVVGDFSEPLPSDCHAVLRSSVQHHRLVGSVRHIAGSRPLLLRQRPRGQVVVELLDADRTKVPSGGLTTGDWVVTASPEMTMALETVLGPGVLELGEPRLDRWHSPGRGPTRAALRRWLSIAEAQVAVLLQMGPDPDLDLDLDELVAALGPAYAVLVTDAGISPRPGRVWDVSRLPDLGDLVLVADQVVTTPGSALAHDAVSAGRPVVQVGRGEPRLPGPACIDTEGVAAALMMPRAVTKDLEMRFRASRLPHDDGAAADRVVDRLVGPVDDEGDDSVNR